MSHLSFNRRHVLLGAGACGVAMAASSAGLVLPASASQRFAPTKTMRGGANNYSPNAPLVDNLGTGFLMYGSVLKAGSGDPLSNVRIQIWAATLRGGEREPSNHGSVMTKADGTFELEMTQIVPNFGQAHGHLAYDDGAFKTVFLRPVMSSASDTSLQANFVLEPA